MRTLRSLILLVFAALAGALPAAGSFEIERGGGRAAGLAGAFTGLADDADAVIYNPAGLIQASRPVLSLNYAQLLSGLEDAQLDEGRVAYLQPLGRAGVAAGTWYQRQLSALYQENILSLHYAYALDDEERYTLAAGLKWMQLAYLESGLQESNPYFREGVQASGIGVDLGARIALADNFAAGLALANINQPNVAVGAGASSVVPLQVRLGGAYLDEVWEADADLLWQADGNRICLGGERWWFDRLLATRLGFGATDRGGSEITAGLSFKLEWPDFSGQIDYAFVNPLGDFAFAGPTHQFNFSIYFGGNTERLDAMKVKRLVEAGRKARGQGKLEEALDQWEQAREIQPPDEELAEEIEALKLQIQRESEVRIHLQQGRSYLEAGHHHNAVAEFRKVLALIPEHAEAGRLLEIAEARIQRMSQAQKQQEEKAARESQRQENLKKHREASRAVQRAAFALDRAERDSRLRTLDADLRRLRSQLDDARASLRAGAFEHGQAIAETVSAEIAKLPAKFSRKEKREARVRKKEPEPVAAATPVPAAAPVADPKPLAVPSEETETEELPDLRLQRKARGAYGLAVKMMLEIDQAKGQKYFPARYQEMKQDLARVRTLLKSQDYETTIQYAEKSSPTLQKLTHDAQEKDQAHKAMPTTW